MEQFRSGTVNIHLIFINIMPNKEDNLISMKNLVIILNTQQMLVITMNSL